MIYMPQITQNDCGIACVKMLLADLNDDKNYLFLPFKEKKTNYSFLEIKDFAKHYGLYLEGFKVEDKEDFLKNEQFPLIVSLISKDDGHHAVIVTKIHKKTVYIMDPLVGERRMSCTQFLSVFEGKGLWIQKVDYYPCPFVFNEPKKRMNTFFHILLQVLGSFCLFAGVYSINKDGYIVLTIVCFSLFVVLEIILRTSLFSSMRFLDSWYLDNLTIEAPLFSEFYYRLEDYKKTKLTSPLLAISALLTAGAFMGIMIFNDVMNVLSIGMAFVLVIIDSLFIEPCLKNKNEAISRIEKEALVYDNRVEFVLKMDDLYNESYRYGKIVLFKKYIYGLLLFFTVLLTMVLNHIISVPYIVLYLCLSISLFQNLNTVFSFPSKHLEYQKSKSRLINIVHQNDEIIH